MRYLIVGLILLLISVWVGTLIAGSAGYVLISYGHWRIETTLWVALFAVIILFVVIYIVIRLLSWLTGISSKLKRRQKMRYRRKSRQLTNLGLCELAEGRWQKAEQLLVKSAKISRTPLINYLAAARAAQGQQAYERRDNYLRLAHSKTKGTELAVGLTQAQLQIDSQQWEQALATLQHLYQLDAQHPYTLKLLKLVYTELNDWQALQTLLPQLKKHHVLKPADMLNFEKQLYAALLARANKLSVAELQEAWNKLPRQWHQDQSLVRTYIKYLLQHQEDCQALKLLEAHIRKQWDSELVMLYGLTLSDQPGKQLSIAESWLKKYPKQPVLFLCLGQLSMREQFWGKAREYLEASIKLAPTEKAYYLLANIYTELNENDKALGFYKKALELNLTHISKV